MKTLVFLFVVACATTTAANAQSHGGLVAVAAGEGFDIFFASGDNNPFLAIVLRDEERGMFFGARDLAPEEAVVYGRPGRAVVVAKVRGVWQTPDGGCRSDTQAVEMVWVSRLNTWGVAQVETHASESVRWQVKGYAFDARFTMRVEGVDGIADATLWPVASSTQFRASLSC